MVRDILYAKLKYPIDALVAKRLRRLVYTEEIVSSILTQGIIFARVAVCGRKLSVTTVELLPVVCDRSTGIR